MIMLTEALSAATRASRETPIGSLRDRALRGRALEPEGEFRLGNGSESPARGAGGRRLFQQPEASLQRHLVRGRAGRAERAGPGVQNSRQILAHGTSIRSGIGAPS